MSRHTALIFGGSGKVARHLTKQLSTQGHTVYSIIRKPEQKPDIESLGGKPIVQSIEDSSVDDMAATMTSTGASCIIWSAGAGGGNPDRTTAVDRDGAIRSFDAAAKAGVRRYIMVSAVDIRDRENKPEPEWYDDADRAQSDRMWGAIGHYARMKLAADKDLVEGNGRRGLEWTIVRPTTLGEGEGTARIEAGKVHMGQKVARADVARVVVECLRNEGTKGLAFDVVGGEIEVAEAVDGVVKGRVDCFEGRY